MAQPTQVPETIAALQGKAGQSGEQSPSRRPASRRSILRLAGGVALSGAVSGALLSALPAGAQVPDPGPGGRRGDPNQFRDQMKARLKELLGAADDEWKILEPRIDKVQDLQQVSLSGRGMGLALLFGGRGGGFGGPGRGGGGRFNRDPGPPSSVQMKWQELQATIENKDAGPERYKAALTAYREARNQVQNDLLKSQNELRDLLTPRQEAILVALGTLD